MLALALDLMEHFGEVAAAQKEVDEAGARDLVFFYQRIFKVDIVKNDLRRLCGSHAEHPRACHSDVGGDIAVRAVGRLFDDEVGQLARGQVALVHCRLDG